MTEILEERRRRLVEKYPTRESHPNWDLEHALVFYRSVHNEVHRCGYIAALGGSVMERGRGRDLDLVLVGWRETTDDDLPALIAIFLMKGFEAIDMYQGIDDAQRAIGMCDMDGYLLDVQIVNKVVKRFNPHAA